MRDCAANVDDVGRAVPADLCAHSFCDGGHGPPYRIPLPSRCRLGRVQGRGSDLNVGPGACASGSDWRRAFSLVEIMVVIGILALLIGIVFKGGGALITRAKVRDTEALLKSLNQALQAYASDVNQVRIPCVKDIYGGFPPDNIYVFDEIGVNLGCASGNVVMVSGTSNADIKPDLPGLIDQRASSGALQTLAQQELKHGDMRAMVLAMRLRSPKASQILDRIDARFKRSQVDEPAMGAFFDPGDGTAQIYLDYYVDAWGTPLEYFSYKDGNLALSPRDRASARIVLASGGVPVIASYGPNGPDQLSSDFMATYQDTTIVGDYWTLPVPSATQLGLVNHESNDDNIYSADGLKERLRTGS